MDDKIILPPGGMITANGSRYHLRRWGGTGPTLLLETGLTLMSNCWGWLAPALARSNRVVAYDRAGLGWSDEREGLRDAEQVAIELDDVIKAAPVDAPLVLVGHSMGAIFNRAFAQLHPEMISAMVWLDPAHPDQLPRSRRMKTFVFLLEFAHLMAARNLPSITLRIVPHLKGLPESDYRAVRRFLKDPRHLRTAAREARAWNISADHIRAATFRDLPLLVISAQKNALGNWTNYQRELASLSSRSHHVTFTQMSHLSMLANREHAERVATEIGNFLNRAR